MKFSKKSTDILTENLCFTDYTIVTEEISNLELEIERLNSIIKEAREKIRNVNISYLGLRSGKTFTQKLLIDILEILDKEKE